MLLANGYRLVDAAANQGPGGNSVAVAYISQNANGLFVKDQYYNNPFMFGNKDDSLTPEQLALPGAIATPTAGLGIAAVLTGGLALGPEASAAALAAAKTCAANPVLCFNQATIAIGELIAGPAMPAGTGAAVVLASKINNFYRDGASPEIIQQTFNQAALSSTHNAGASEVVLGKYIAGSDSSYEAVAQARGSTYFSMSDWATVQGQLGESQMWNINKAFLDQQMAAGKSFIFTADPAQASLRSYTYREYQYLQNSGCEISLGKDGYYHAVNK
ncbi:UNVERIFIED_ORG: filamentous hemagglutinin [Paraburkholderia sediminicola]|uniref:hypothetical protein n=1 Tax=Paraburkholderia TaxID=1822464 RepID=UPI0021136B54|nr:MULTISPECIES: hypothetical protein [Paraburkholderia]MCP2087412.1 filamentous hemagglutinin [Paraburkholderia sediminicola]MCX4143227.1 hypothetical protein [Paraburkholderia aspalathi]MDN7175901.1 hypothetical protein [Paraburkholderia sp. SEWSISQ10-3 4]MDQ6505542.1 hypothetical protein [Paraburkholderia aspalathi]